MLTLSSTLIIKDFLTSVFMWQEENQIGEEKVTVGTNTCSHSKKGTHDGIVAKKRDPGILDPELFLAQIRKVEARLGKLAKIRKVETD